MDTGFSVAPLIGVFALLVGLAMVAVLVSQKANTSAVIQALATGGSDLIKAATAPVSG